MAFTTVTERILEAAPPWLHGPNGKAMLSTIGLMCDLGQEDNVFAVSQRFINSPACTTDSLAYAGQERMLPKLPGETTEQYRSRVHNAWLAWELAGTGTTIINQLAILGIEAELKQANDPAWDWGPTASWRSMWVVLRQHNMGEVPVWGEFLWGDGTVWGGTEEAATQLALVQKLVKQFRPAHMRVENIIVVHDLATWDATPPDGTWDVPANRPDSTVATFWPGPE